MKVIVTSESRKVYTRILLSFIVGIVITLLISSTILYVNFERIALQQVYRSDLNSLQQTSSELSKISQAAKSVSQQIYQDYMVAPLLYYPTPNIYDYTVAMSQLSSYRAALPFIESIYIHNTKSREIYSSTEKGSGRYELTDFVDTEIIRILDNFQDYLPFNPIPRMYKAYKPGAIEFSNVSSYTYLCYNALNKDLDYVVVVNIKESWVNDNISSSDHEAGEQTIIINKEGTLYSSSLNSPILTDYSKKSYMDKILADPSSSNYFVHNADGVKSLITYTKPDSLGWRYVRITPHSTITKEIMSMKLKTIYFSLGFLSLGLLISVFMSRRLHGPIDKVMHTMRVLENEKRNNLQIIRQEFLRNFILGRESYHTKALQEKLLYFGSSLDMNGSSVLVLLRIDQYRMFMDKFNDDVKLLKYAIMNICTEIGTSTYHMEAIDMGDDSVLLIINRADSSSPMNDANFEMMLKDMQLSILSHLKLSVSITVSPSEELIDQLIPLFKQVMEASHHRLFRGHGSIIMSDEIMSLKSKAYEFPVNKQKQWVDSIMSGKLDDARKIYTEIIQETAEYPYTVIQLAISHLTLTINNVLHALKKNNAVSMQLEFDNTIVALNQVETINEINDQFFALFDGLSKQQEEKRSNKQEELIRRINDIIERDYSNSNLCLNSIADELIMSPVYISRLYKQLTLLTLTDVINDLRMTKAKEWLLQTDCSVAEIAEKAGFTSSSYFYRMFKRSTGVTPNDFRRVQNGA